MGVVVKERKGAEEGQEEDWDEEDSTEEDRVSRREEEVGQVDLRDEREEDKEGERGVDQPGMGEIIVDKGKGRESAKYINRGISF